MKIKLKAWQCKGLAILVFLAIFIVIGIHLRFIPLVRFIEKNQIYTHYVDITDTIMCAALAENDYQPFKLCMTEEVFHQLNLKHNIKGVFYEYETIELYQKKDKDDSRIIYVDIRSSYDVKDQDGNIITAGRDRIQQYTVFVDQNQSYIIHFYDPISTDWYYR